MSVTVSENVNPAKTLLAETQLLFHFVSTHNFDALADLCDDDFGIIDLDENGKNVVVKNREEWEAWFRNLFAKLTALNAQTYTTITEYNVLETTEMAMSVVTFTQYLELQGMQYPFNCITTIVWKKVGSRWIEARWHISLLERLPPVAA